MNSPKKNKMSNEAQAFKNFIKCAVTFVTSMVAIIYVNMMLPPSSMQELIALAGLVLAIPSGALAIFYYLSMLWARFQHFKNR